MATSTEIFYRSFPDPLEIGSWITVIQMIVGKSKTFPSGWDKPVGSGQKSGIVSRGMLDGDGCQGTGKLPSHPNPWRYSH